MKRTLRTLIVTAALGGAALAASSPPLAAVGKHKSIFVTTPPTGKPVDPQTLKCDTLSKGIAPHIETMKQLKAKMERERQTPTNVESMVEKWSGVSPRPGTTDIESKLARERHTTEEIAAMLPAYKCPPYDIEAELKKPMTGKPLDDVEADPFAKPHKKKKF
jgi:hypothetical protein